MGAGWLLFDLNFNPLRLVGSDGHVPFTFMRRLFGEVPDANAYQFGLALFEAPFYALGKLLAATGVTGSALSADSFRFSSGAGPAAIALGTGLFVVAAAAILVYVLDGMELRAAALAIAAAFLGTPLVFYATFYPGKTHTVDAFLFTAVVGLAFAYFRRSEPSVRLPLLLGGVLGASIAVRYFAAAEAAALVAVLLAYRRRLHALAVAAATAGSALLLFLIPLALGSPQLFQSETPAGYRPGQIIVLAPLNPFRMLFTDHRGLFVWSPVALLGAIGFVRLLVRRPAHRPFLVAAGAMGSAIVFSYMFIPWWDATYSFSQRYYTPLFPLVVLGLAGLLEWRSRLVAAAAVVCAVWSLFLLLNLQTVGGPRYEHGTIEGGATDLAVRPFEANLSPGAYVWGIRNASRLLP